MKGGPEEFALGFERTYEDLKLEKTILSVAGKEVGFERTYED